MSVVKSKRTVSYMEVINQSSRIRQEIEALCIRNLGLRDPGVIARKKYRIGRDHHYSPDRYILILTSAKENLRLLALEAQLFILEAEQTYPKNKKEYEFRRLSMTRAINMYEMIIKEFQHVVTVCEVDINMFKQYLDSIDYEIALVKRWRQSDNRRIG